VTPYARGSAPIESTPGWVKHFGMGLAILMLAILAKPLLGEHGPGAQLPSW